MEIGSYVRLRASAKCFLFPSHSVRELPFSITDAESYYALSALHAIVMRYSAHDPDVYVINLELGRGRVERLPVHVSYLVRVSPLEALASEA